MRKEIGVFIASPGDLAVERKHFRDVVSELNGGFADGANVRFNALGWEDTLSSTGRRSQSVINAEVDKCDVFVLVLHRRWGQSAPDAAPFSSYTEEEFYRALGRWKETGSPEIFVFFKRVDTASEADPGEQLKKVIDFRKQLEDSRQVLYHYFDDEISFSNKVDRHLRAFVKGELPKAATRDIFVLPPVLLNEVEAAKKTAMQNLAEANKARDAERAAQLKIAAMEFQAAQDAAQLSREGKVEFAKEKFARLIVESSDARVLQLAYEFCNRTGDVKSAFSVLEKIQEMHPNDTESQVAAYVFGNRGMLYETIGEIGLATEMLEKSLAISEKLGQETGVAVNCTNLGIIYFGQGDHDKAEHMFQKSLAIEEQLGDKEGMAGTYCNLALIYHARGQLEAAEAMFLKALSMEESLDHKEGMACAYGNLGRLYQELGDRERAEGMYRKSLQIEIELGRKEGIAADYSNLGTLHYSRGQFEQAEEMYLEALRINQEIGRKGGIAAQYGNLGVLYSQHGKLDQAEKMHLNSLSLEEALGRPDGIVTDCWNLGVIYEHRGDLVSAEQMYSKGLTLCKKLSLPRTHTFEDRLKKLSLKANKKIDE